MTVRLDDITFLQLNKRTLYEAKAILAREIHYEAEVRIRRGQPAHLEWELKRFLSDVSLDPEFSCRVKINFTIDFYLGDKRVSYRSRWFDHREFRNGSSLNDGHTPSQWRRWFGTGRWTATGWTYYFPNDAFPQLAHIRHYVVNDDPDFRDKSGQDFVEFLEKFFEDD